MKSSKSKNKNVPQQTDIAIVGGGLVGASLACCLGKLCPELNVSVIEAQTIPLQSPTNNARHVSYDTRGTALSYGTRKIYEHIDLWEQMAPYATPIHKVHVSDKSHLGTTCIDRDDEKIEALGYVVENQCIGPVLLKKIAAMPNVHWYNPAVVSDIKVLADRMRVYLSCDDLKGREPEAIDAKLVVVCDGVDSPMRNKLGIDVNVRSYEQHAVIANVSASLPHNNVAYERFTDLGPMALLPLNEFGVMQADHRCALVWTLPTAKALEVLQLNDEAFLQLLQERFGNRLGNFIRAGKRYSYPLNLVTAVEQVRSGLVIMGNAAHSLHPVAGQCYNLAVRDLFCLAQILAQAAKAGKSIGSLVVLNDYLLQQKRDQAMVVEFSDKLVKLFSNNNTVLAVGRNLGLLAMDLLPGIKPIFSRYATGQGNTIVHN